LNFGLGVAVILAGRRGCLDVIGSFPVGLPHLRSHFREVTTAKCVTPKSLTRSVRERVHILYPACHFEQSSLNRK
ncbi:MAG: hypothetical protein ACXWIJ_19600, partial [Burkholderiales bacterium]